VQQLGDERREHPEPDDEDAPQDAGGPAQAQVQVSLPVGHETAAPVDDEHLLLRHNGDDRRRRHAPHAPPARAHLEVRRVVRTAVREDPLHRAVAAARDGESDAVGEPVTGDGTRGVEPPALAQYNRHPRPPTPLPRHAKLPLVTAIEELVENRTIEGVYAVARKERLRTRNGSSYLALELVDASGRIGARVWNDVELLDGRFEAGDAVRVLGRVERFRNELQVEVRTLEPAEGVDPTGLTPGLRRDADELEGFLEFLVGEVHDDALRGVVTRALAEAPLRAYPATPDGHHSYAGGLLEHTVGVATLCRELAQIHPRLRADLLLAAALVHDVGRARELGRPPVFAPTEEGRLLGHVHLGLRSLEALGAPAELLHAVACHHDARAARTAEAAVLYHANQLDAVAATRPVPD
jgi:3'-5' exoribonuclease